MKRNILLVLFVAVFAFAVTFVGCKQQAAEEAAPAVTEEAAPAAEGAAPAATEEAAPAAQEAAPAQ